MTVSYRVSRKPEYELTVVCHRLPERWSNAQDNAGEYILKAGKQEQGRVFGVLNVGLLGVQNRRYKPRNWLV